MQTKLQLRPLHPHLLSMALAVIELGVGAMSSAIAASDTTPLFTEDQIKVEALVAKLLASPEMKKQRAEVLKRYQADPSAATPDGQKTLHGAVDELAAAAALGAANGDPTDPKMIWWNTAPITWGKHKKLGSRWTVDNPDQVYRFFPINGTSRYEVMVRPRGPVPTQFSIMLMYSLMGEDTKHFLDEVIGGLQDRDIKTEADGSFKVTIDGDSANGRVNHIQSTADARTVWIRDSMDDWDKQRPFDIRVKRVDDAPAAKPANFRQMAERAAYLLENGANTNYWFKSRGLVNKQPNLLSKPWLRGGGWGFNVNGQFKLADDEALLINVNRLGAKFLSIVVDDPWLRSRDPIHANGSLNGTMAEADADGSYSYVVSANDPGVRNWVDTEGLHEGLVLIRWQALPPTLTSVDSAVRSVKVVKLADVPQLLPEATGVTPQQRAQQYTARAQSYARRYLP
ncbi:MAG: hypothetical protein PHQ05_00615 [Sterolibacterium sp.]|nr:hypothetical protein [Sterolibacterium sp.]